MAPLLCGDLSIIFVYSIDNGFIMSIPYILATGGLVTSIDRALEGTLINFKFQIQTYFRPCLPRKLSKCQISMQPMRKFR